MIRNIHLCYTLSILHLSYCYKSSVYQCVLVKGNLAEPLGVWQMTDITQCPLRSRFLLPFFPGQKCPTGYFTLQARIEGTMLRVVMMHRTVYIGPGVGVTKAPFVNFSVSKIFDPVKVPVRLLASHSYLTGVTAAELRQHLANMNVIYNS